MARGEAWLKAQLAKALQWDEFVVEGVVDVISKAKSADEVQEIVHDFMENNPAAVAIISDYMEVKGSSKQQRQQSAGTGRAQPVIPPGVKSTAQATYSASIQSSPAKSKGKEQESAVKQQDEKWLNLGQSQAPDSSAADSNETSSALSSKQQAEATLSMFKRGGKVKPRAQPSSSSSSSSRKGQQQLESITANLERKVANCLSCGKIFDCRNVTNDIIQFINAGFHCTFCGNPVAMTQQQRIQQAQQQQQSESSAAVDGGSTSHGMDNATAKAVAFKDRLVDYDRNSQQRTTVIDNQSDYFEIDTNAWLSEEERAELRRREQLEEQAAAERRNKVYVTLDLLGRKVLRAEGPGSTAADAGDSSTSDGAAFQFVSATDQLRQSLPGSSSTSRSASTATAAAAAAATATAASDSVNSKQVPGVAYQPAAALVDEALVSIRDLRITANPTAGMPAPVFVHRAGAAAAAKQQHEKKPKQQQQQQQVEVNKQRGSKGGRSQQQQQRRRQAGSGSSRTTAADTRLQDDSIFWEFGAELLYDDLVNQQTGKPQPAVA